MRESHRNPGDPFSADPSHDEKEPTVPRANQPPNRSCLGLRPFGILIPTLFLLALWTPGLTAAGELRWVAEMETPEGILVQPKALRSQLAKDAAGQRGLAILQQAVGELWPEIRQADLEALSRHQIEATRGYRLPEDPGEWTGQILGLDKAGHYHLELRGPRLPAAYDIVHRYLHIYASFDPTTGALDRTAATIRGWIWE